MRRLRYIAVVGSRHARRADVLKAFTDLKLTAKNHAIVSGGARGADHWAKQLAIEGGFEYVECPAFWNERGKGAGHARNATIVDLADAIVAVWDGQSPGTQSTIGLAEKAGKKVALFLFEPAIDEKTQQVVTDGN